MGPSENPTSHPKKQEVLRKRPARRPRRRRCLLKGCERRFRPQRARERYCSPGCREGARRWSRWKAQDRYRATPEGKQRRNGQSRRYRERVRNRQAPAKEAVPEAARVITELPPKIFFRPPLRSTRLLRRVRVQPEITVPAVLLARVSACAGAGSGARAALGAEASRLN
jgi:hypothetical protein